MAGWAGFTDEDLRKLKVPVKDGARSNLLSGAVINKKPSQLKRPRTTKNLTNETPQNSTLHPSQRLNQPQSTGGSTKTDKQLVSSNHGNPKPTKDVEMKEKIQDGGQSTSADSSVSDEKVARELDEVEAISSEINKMETFQKQQKMIEEANKQKRDYLSKAISERKKKAKAENEKLTKIQKELAHLDDLLSSDVGIIRYKIEEASLHYLEAQRKYEKAEEEFIKAKMNLFEKGDLKEQLTVHLYTIINQNEIRKAKKLSELMKQLEMEISMEEMELQMSTIPPLTNLNSVQTLNCPRKISESSSHQNHVDGESKLTNDHVVTTQVTNEHATNIQKVTNEQAVKVENVANEKGVGIQNVTNEKGVGIQNVTNEQGVGIQNVTNEQGVGSQNVTNEQGVGIQNVTNEQGVDNENVVNENMNNNQMVLTPGLQDSNETSEKTCHLESPLTSESKNPTLPGADNSCSNSAETTVVCDAKTVQTNNNVCSV